MIRTLTQLIRRTRQHHAIEHATIHLLSARYREQRFSGFSDPLGFTLLADVPLDQVQRSVSDAMLRLQAGQHDLAVHPNCGTSLAISGLLLSLMALVGAAGRRSMADKLSTTLPLILAGLLISRPLGLQAQSYTTLAQIGDRWLTDVQPFTVAGRQLYRVILE